MDASDRDLPYRTGEEVRHRKRPEWGAGRVERVEMVRHGDRSDQRLWIRFANAGMKVLLASVGELDRLSSPEVVGEAQTLADREARHEGGWLGQIARAKPEDAMTSLPPEVSDPFLTLRKRLELTIGLYRFQPIGGRLLDWAVAQSGLTDPLSRFNRHELEQFFERWAHRRDQHLARLATECRQEPGLFDLMMRTAPPAAHRAMRKLHVGR